MFASIYNYLNILWTVWLIFTFYRKIHKIVNILKDMEVEGISEVIRRNNIDQNQDTPEDSNKNPNDFEGKTSVTMFKGWLSNDKDPTVDLVSLFKTYQF